MAITDFEPAEAAAIVLDYALSDKLSKGQIQQMSHDMLEDKLSEEFPDISLQKRLFDVNELLYKAFNGTFPTAEHILWSLDKTGEHQYRIITSEYWLDAEDFPESSFESTIREYEEPEEDGD